MPKFYYRALQRHSGKIEDGELEVATEAMVLAYLQKNSLIPMQIKPAGGISSLFRKPKNNVKFKDIIMLTRELATLLESGLPLDRALQILIGLVSDTPHFKTLLESIQNKIRGGSTFSQALEAQGGVFTRLYINTIRAGEASGGLEKALRKLADYLERNAALRGSITSALIYPTILILVAATSVIVLLVFVVPQFTQMFEDMGKDLPLSTQIVIAAGDIIRNYWWVILVIIGVGAAIGSKLLQQPNLRLAWDKYWLNFPMLGDMLWKLETARFCHTLATLLENGMPLLGAMGLAKEVVENSWISSKLSGIIDALKHGKGLATPLHEAKAFPKLALQLISVGEEAGNLDSMLTRVANIYDTETRLAIQRLLTILEPALIVGLGLMVSGIIVSILAAILGANELVMQ
ncbi:general secretion pathway protein GspF [Achromatium sp. WMS2]|nr:general secretion pathway protein GspF [Achromatium sp. WMS2]